jgi:hypothetical protein
MILFPHDLQDLMILFPHDLEGLMMIFPLSMYRTFVQELTASGYNIACRYATHEDDRTWSSDTATILSQFHPLMLSCQYFLTFPSERFPTNFLYRNSVRSSFSVPYHTHRVCSVQHLNITAAAVCLDTAYWRLTSLC